MEENYKVYMHIFPNNKVYIGITKMNPRERWHSGLGYHKNQPLMYNAIQKYGWKNVKHSILYTNLTKEEAEQKEIELIKRYKSNQKSYGYNIDNGGNHQGKTSEITKEKLRIKNGGKNNYWYGKHLTPEHKLKIKTAKSGIRTGGAIKLMKPVLQYDLEKKFVAKYECMKEAQRQTKIPYQNISMCCRNVIKKTHGYIFEYENQGQ